METDIDVLGGVVALEQRIHVIKHDVLYITASNGVPISVTCPVPPHNLESWACRSA